MKVVVFGATGMIGTRIAAELERRGRCVTAAAGATGADVTDPQSVASAGAGAGADGAKRRRTPAAAAVTRSCFRAADGSHRRPTVGPWITQMNAPIGS